MSSEVRSNLESLTNFRNDLIRFNRLIAEEFSLMQAKWRSLGEVWTDVKYHEFGQALEEATQSINRYLAATEGHEAHLLGLMERLREYLEYR